MGLTRSIVSIEGCWRNHGFPWTYPDVSWSVDGQLCCPSCGTWIERLWTTA